MEDTKMNEMLTDETGEEMEIYELYEEPSGGILSKAIVGVVGSAIAAVGTVAIVKNKDKIKQWREEKKIQKLEKKGYVITKAPCCEECECIEVEEVELEE